MRKVSEERFIKAREYLRNSREYSIVKYVKENITSDIDTSGRNPKCSCPFHGRDSRPSFSIMEEQKYFQCFGCGKAGDIINLIRFMEEKESGRLPSASFIIERIINNDPQVRLDLSMNTIYVSDEISREQVLMKVRKDFKPKPINTLHTLPQLKRWMVKNNYMEMNHIITAIGYAQSGLDPDTIKKVLMGEMVNDVIVENLSDFNLEDYGLDFGEESFDL